MPEPNPLQGPLLVLFVILGLVMQGVFMYKREWFDDPLRVQALALARALLFALALVLEHAGFESTTIFIGY